METPHWQEAGAHFGSLLHPSLRAGASLSVWWVSDPNGVACLGFLLQGRELKHPPLLRQLVGSCSLDPPSTSGTLSNSLNPQLPEAGQKSGLHYETQRGSLL